MEGCSYSLTVSISIKFTLITLSKAFPLLEPSIKFTRGVYAMHKKALPVGVDLFEHLIRENYYYVDKTNLIRELLDTKGIVTLFTRPRRFGKTLNMSMLQYYFEDMRARDGSRVDNRDLFKGLNIMQAGERYTSQMGQYPVIFLSLQSRIGK